MGSFSLRDLIGSVALADEAQIMRIVTMVDAMAQRGAADDLIAPLRPRLKGLSPPRPLRFPRLLFYPLGLVMVAAPGWEAHHSTIPRVAIGPLTQLVETALDAQVSSAKQVILGRHVHDADLIAHLGTTLWPEAGAVLLRAEQPSSWLRTGLEKQAFVTITRLTGAALSFAPTIHALRTDTAHGRFPPDRKAIETLLGEITGTVPDALGMLITLLLLTVPGAAAQLHVILSGQNARPVRAVADRAAERLLDRLETDLAIGASIMTSALGDAGVAAQRTLALLRELDQPDAPAGRNRRLHELRQTIQVACETRFTNGLQAELLAPLRALSGPQETEAVAALEAIARDLRTLETTARHLGGGRAYDQLLTDAARIVCAHSEQSGLSPVDRVRLVEILAGPDAALAMLAGA